MEVQLRKLVDTDIPLMESWLQKEHVACWYHEPEEWLMELRERENTFKFLHHFIVLKDGQPAGFGQYYCCADAEEEWYGPLNLEETYSIDYLIGSPYDLGKGLGKAIVSLLTEVVFQLENSEQIIVQPDSENLASCGALKSNGYMFDKQNNYFIRSRT